MSLLGLMGCNVSQTQQCVAELGKPLIFNLPTNAASITLKTKQTTILNIVNNLTVLDQRHKGLYILVTNGSVKLINAMKNHSGDYQWDVFHHNGKTLHKLHMHLKIQGKICFSKKNKCFHKM